MSTLSPIPAVNAMLVLIQNATTQARLDALVSGNGLSDADKRTTAMYQLLHADDKATVRNAWGQRRDAIKGIVPQVSNPAASEESLGTTLATISGEVGDGQTTGSMANGMRRGVGFSSHEGYRVALQRGGLQPHTRAEYLRIVGGPDVYPPANNPTQAVTASPLLNGATHRGDGGATLAANVRAARRREARTNAQSPEGRAATIAAARAAGAKLAGYDGQVTDPASTDIGSIVAFGRNAHTEKDPLTGKDRQMLIPWGDIEAIRVSLGLDPGAFGRAPGTVGMLGDATDILNHGGYVARRIKAAAIPQYPADPNNPDAMMPVASAWKIGFFDNSATSDSLGKREATIWLRRVGSGENAGYEIGCDDPEHSGASKVIADYERRVAGIMIPADKFLGRCEDAMRRVCGARMTDLGMYVSPTMADRAVDLCNALRPIMGRNVYCYAHTHKASLASALTDSLQRDLAALERDYAKPDYKWGPAAITRVEKLKTAVNGLSGFFGPDVTAEYLDRLAKCDELAVKGLDSTSQRAQMIELD